LSKQIIENSNYFTSKLKTYLELKNIRNIGYLIGMDFETKKFRDDFVQAIKKNGLLCNPTRSNTIRFRPHLLSNRIDFDNALSIINKSLGELKVK
jgi:ornithine--oxo-acid transaminase